MKNKAAANIMAGQVDFDGLANFGKYRDCLYRCRARAVKVFMPDISKKYGGLMLSGYIGFFNRGDIGDEALDNGSLTDPESMSLSHLHNYPDLVLLSEFSASSGARKEYLTEIDILLDMMPNSKEEAVEEFGKDFFAKDPVLRSVVLTKFLRRKYCKV